MSESNQEKLFDLDLLALPDVSDSLFLDNQIVGNEGDKYIIFMINDSYFAIVSSKVSEVIRPLPYTTVPNLPDWFLGIANLRGDIISIIDLRTLWKLESSDSPKTKFIVLRSEDTDSYIAFKVDKLREIVTLKPEEIKTNTKDSLPHRFGTAKHKNKEINILNIDEILSAVTLKQ